MKAKNKAKRLDQRRQDYQKMMSTTRASSKVESRKAAGGYHKPGSNNK